jgi:chondroitin synthase
MFTARAWNLTSGFDRNITNAVDYDMYLKLSEVGPFKHINKICYNRVLHGENTSIKKLKQQKENHFTVVNNALCRQGLSSSFRYVPVSQEDACRRYRFEG